MALQWHTDKKNRRHLAEWLMKQGFRPNLLEQCWTKKDEETGATVFARVGNYGQDLFVTYDCDEQN